MEALDLCFKVLELLPCRDAGVDGLDFLGFFSPWFTVFVHGKFLLSLQSCKIVEGVFVEHPMSPLALPDIWQSSCLCPSEECAPFDSQDSLSFGRFDIKSVIDLCIRRDALPLLCSYMRGAWILAGKSFWNSF